MLVLCTLSYALLRHAVLRYTILTSDCVHAMTQLHHALFELNGGRGFVLKPPEMLEGYLYLSYE